MNLYQIFQNEKIIPVVKINDSRNALGLAKALLAGGMHTAEITFRTGAAEESIRTIAEKVPNLLVCAGTVLDEETAQKAVGAGAKAIISPGTNPAVVKWCLENGVAVIPGCATPTEIESNMRMGLSVVKFFPAEAAGGVRMLKALYGPYSSMRFMPTGGINPENIRDYLSLPNVLCCGGSWIAPEKELDTGNFSVIEENVRKALTKIA